MKPRLFILGDSFVDWNIPKNHWTYYLSKHFDIRNFGNAGADNYSIIFQLGYLPKYENGDRILIVFTEPGRLPRRFYGKRKKQYEDTIYMATMFYDDYDFAKKLHLLKYDESERWVNGERNIEIDFLKNLKEWLKDYKPIYISWSEHMAKPTNGLVNYFKVSSNFEEGISEERDFHPGPMGCYELYKIVYNLLEIKDEMVEFEKEIKPIL